MGIGARLGRDVLWATFDPEEAAAIGGDMRLHAEARATAEPLRRDAAAFDIRTCHGWEIDVVKEAVILLIPMALLDQRAYNFRTMFCGGLEWIIEMGVIGAEILRKGNGGKALQGGLHRAANRARVKHVFGGVIAFIDARENEIGGAVFEDIMQACHHAISGAAFGGKTAGAEFRDHGGVHIRDAMANARLLEGGGDCPDLALGACDLSGDCFEHFEPRCIDPVVIGDENAHACSYLCCLQQVLTEGPRYGKQNRGAAPAAAGPPYPGVFVG